MALYSWEGLTNQCSTMVEGEAVCVGACPIRHLGWCLHHVYDQHIWSSAFSPHWMARSKLRFAASNSE